MDYQKKAVGHTQDWSDPDRAIEEIERATAAREELESKTSWFDKLVKSAPQSAHEQDEASGEEKPAPRKPRSGRRRAPKP